MINKIIEVQKQLTEDRLQLLNIKGKKVEKISFHTVRGSTGVFNDAALISSLQEHAVHLLETRIKDNEAFLQTVEDLLGEGDDKDESV